MSRQALVAVDLGAESGRVVRGCFEGDRLTLEEAHRFANVPVRAQGTLRWDVLRLFSDLRDGLRAAGPARSIGIDAWGVDFGLLDRSGALLGNPVHYRDERTRGMLAEADARVPAAERYATTGIQLLEINTVYQLLAMATREDPQLEAADTLLMLPALLTSWLCGVSANEVTDASTSGLYDPVAGAWALGLIARLGLPTRLFEGAPLAQPGADLGPLLPEFELGAARIVATASHDTASAVAAVPFEPGRAGAYISSGSWSLVGLEMPAPHLGAPALAANLTNEAGVAGTTRLLRNVMGLWLLQECRRAWGGDLSYTELAAQAERAPAFGPLIDPDDARFLRPADMPSLIAQACGREAMAPGEVVRCVLESLALRYRWVLERLEAVTGTRVELLHVVGGGASHRLLCQMTADATGRPLTAGPVEATALGNLLVQALALGLVGSLAEARELARRSVSIERYEPVEDQRWQEAWARFRSLLAEREGENE